MWIANGVGRPPAQLIGMGDGPPARSMISNGIASHPPWKSFSTTWQKNIQVMGKFSFSAVHSGKNIQVMGKFKKRIVSVYMCNQSICVVYSVYMCIQSICVVYSVYMCIQSICVSPLLFILRRLITSEWSNYAVQGTRAVVSGFLGAWTDPMGNNVQVKEVCNEVRV